MDENYVLMLEPDHDDRQLTLSVMQELGIQTRISFAATLNEMQDQLSAGAPVVILVDYHLQPETGLDILASIRSHDAWRHIPVVVLGESADPLLVRRSYEQGVNAYVVKPASLERTRAAIAGFFTFWLQVAETPAFSPQMNQAAR